MENKWRKWESGFAVIGEFEVKREQRMPPSYTEMQIQPYAMTKQLPISQYSVDYQQLQSLASKIPLHMYREHLETFDEWFFKYDVILSTILKKHNTTLCDRAKVRLLFMRLGECEYEKLLECVKPKQVAALTFHEMIAKLMSLFARIKSRTTRRLQFLQINQKENEDSFSYSERIDKACCAAEMDAIDEETMKCLVYIIGLKAANQADLRKRLIEKMDNSITPPSLKDMKAVAKALERKKKPKKPPHGAPWEAVHVGYVKVLGQCFVVLLDEYSQWPEIVPAADFSAQSCIDCIDDVFIEHGMPQTIVTNKSNQFFSGRFKSYCYDNHINHCSFTDYQEFYDQFIDYFKAFVSVNSDDSDYEDASYIVNNFLSHFRDMALGTAPGALTPAELMFGHRIYYHYPESILIPSGYY